MLIFINAAPEGVAFIFGVGSWLEDKGRPMTIEAVSNGHATVVMNEQTYQIKHAGLSKRSAKRVLHLHSFHLMTAGSPGIQGEVSYAAYLGKEIQNNVESSLGSLFVISGVVKKPFKQDDTVIIFFDVDLAWLIAA